MTIQTTTNPVRGRAAADVRTISVLGATGSIGTSTIDLILRNPRRYRVAAVTANSNAAALARLARSVDAKFAAVADPNAYRELKDALGNSGIEAAAGENALVEAALHPADWVMAAISGATGLKPTLAAVERGAMVGLANKECLVCAGALFMRRAAHSKATVLPVDSEHNALFQAMASGRRDEVRRVVITASGGPFRTWSKDAIAGATREQALKHPNWSMGAKITIDSASMMNKGLEIIEAHHLFALPSEQIDVLVHPQSIVHGMVEFLDGSFVAQLGPPDMRVPIAHCLSWPDRLPDAAARLDWTKVTSLAFEQPDLDRFPALRLARQALEAGGAASTVLNAANEVAVAAFLAERLHFAGIAGLVEAAMDAAEGRGLTKEPATIDEALAIDHNSRQIASELLPGIAAKAS
ncbi:MAG: 1-deoxy-D-xylulose-5-phosphate reductoisomerase [Pseudorhodoplanes sp.]|nr:1-deoxy-D-xylulose-5-phosphate reductoisomerase [Pseudorhodoplanes sp.]